jgi:hypothetical protein
MGTSSPVETLFNMPGVYMLEATWREGSGESMAGDLAQQQSAQQKEARIDGCAGLLGLADVAHLTRMFSSRVGLSQWPVRVC